MPGRPRRASGSSASGTGMKPSRTHTRSRPCGRAKIVSIFAASVDASARKARLSQSLLLAKHRVLDALGQPELHDALGRDLDRLARLWVAAHPRLAVGQHQPPEVRQHENVLGFLDREPFE